MKNADYKAFIGELRKLFKESSESQSIFDSTVRMVSELIECDAGSIYIYNEGTDSLVLSAEHDKAADPVHRYRSKIMEGLAGLSIRESRVIYEKNSGDSSGDGSVDSLVALPIVRGLEKIGVLVLARDRKIQFSDDEINLSKLITGQLADLIDSRFMLYMINRSKNVQPFKKEEESFFRGRIISEGYRYSGIYFFDQIKQFEIFKKMKIDKPCSKEMFLEAVETTSLELKELQNKIKNEFSEAGSMLFETHLMILKDGSFTGEMIKQIDKGESPSAAVIRVSSALVGKLRSSGNQYIAEKAKDIEDIAIRLLRNLIGEIDVLPAISGKIVIARELLLSSLIRLYSEKAGGLILLEGGVTSHLSILARSLKIPSVIVDNAKLMDLPANSKILLDAETGLIYINPGSLVTEKYAERNKVRIELDSRIQGLKKITETLDRVRIKLMVNINLISDLKTAEKIPYDGIGLYRTEFPFLIRRNFPDEEAQYRIYKNIVDGAHGKEVVFRTLDIGGDKILPYYNIQNEKNPFLGMRSIRFSLKNEDIFKQQLRAMLRAGAGARIKIMFPMVSSIEEFNASKRLLLECRGSLEKDNLPYAADFKTGMMVEVPSAVEIMNDLVKVSEFFSIGSNDLVQYMLAVDRTNEKTADLYITHHPAVLRAIYRVITSCVRHNREVAICGDMANNKKYVTFLVGCGIRNISVEPKSFPAVQEEISKIDTGKAETAVRRILRQSSFNRIGEILDENIHSGS